MKITIEIEVPDDFEPCTCGCDLHCPFGYTDGECCYYMYIDDDNYEWNCPVKDGMKKGNKDE